MNKPVKDIVLEILTVIKYPNDKNNFISEFLSANYTDALIKVSEKFPEDLKKKTAFGNGDFSGITQEDLEKAKQYVSEEDFLKEVDSINKEEIIKLVNGLLPKCNDEEKQQLDAIVASLDEAPVAEVAAPMADAPADPSQMVPPPPPVPPAPAIESPAAPDAVVAQPATDQPQTDVTKPQETTV